jgi:hypothetical protein
VQKRVIDLRSDGEPILDIASYCRVAAPLTPHQLARITMTIRRVPEVMVKVSGGARTLVGVQQHMAYIGRDGELGLETDMGEVVRGKGIEQAVIEDWDLDMDANRGLTERSIRRRQSPKLVHNLIFSMPSGTSPKKLMAAVQKVAANEWQLKHRYVMALHMDSDHPHVHVVLMARDSDGKRLNIRKATLVGGCGQALVGIAVPAGAAWAQRPMGTLPLAPGWVQVHQIWCKMTSSNATLRTVPAWNSEGESARGEKQE